MDLRDIEAVLFDMDGTLVDSDAAVERAWRTWAGEYGVDPARAVPYAHGNPADRTVRLLRPDLGDGAVVEAAARQLALQYHDLSDVTATQGAHELLAALDELSLPWAVVTSADDLLAKVRLAAAGITPPVLITREDVSAGKPDPEGFRAAADRLGVPIARCLVVEDSDPGIAAGRAAGARVAALKGLHGDLRIEHLGQLTHLLAPHPRSAATGDAPELHLLHLHAI